jgi:hypothetical protein
LEGVGAVKTVELGPEHDVVLTATVDVAHAMISPAGSVYVYG